MTTLSLPSSVSKTLSSTAVTASWTAVPPLGNLQAYISAVHNLPMLTLELEQDLARRLRENDDLQAAQQLILSHLRLVVAVSRQYMGYGLPQADLIQEGNVGLMKAVRRFDPSQGVRLVSYALHWIKAEIHEYIIKNWRMVKVATTKAQRKLFFNLRSLKHRLQHTGEAVDTGIETEGEANYVRDRSENLSTQQVQTVAKRLNVKPEEVREMERRMGGADVALDPSPTDGDEERFSPLAYLSDDAHEPSAVLQARERDALASTGLESALAKLDERSRRVVAERWLKVNDDGSGGKTLHELAAEFGVSAERIRQIEVAAMKKMRTFLHAGAANAAA